MCVVIRCMVVLGTHNGAALWQHHVVVVMSVVLIVVVSWCCGTVTINRWVGLKVREYVCRIIYKQEQ